MCLPKNVSHPHGVVHTDQHSRKQKARIQRQKYKSNTAIDPDDLDAANVDDSVSQAVEPTLPSSKKREAQPLEFNDNAKVSVYFPRTNAIHTELSTLTNIPRQQKARMAAADAGGMPSSEHERPLPEEEEEEEEEVPEVENAGPTPLDIDMADNADELRERNEPPSTLRSGFLGLGNLGGGLAKSLLATGSKVVAAIPIAFRRFTKDYRKNDPRME